MMYIILLRNANISSILVIFSDDFLFFSKLSFNFKENEEATNDDIIL